MVSFSLANAVSCLTPSNTSARSVQYKKGGWLWDLGGKARGRYGFGCLDSCSGGIRLSIVLSSTPNVFGTIIA